MDKSEEALLKLEAHERECLIRYENIQDTLNRHHDRFDKLEADAKHGFERLEKLMMYGGGFVTFIVSIVIGLAELLG
tara:strand:+ start:118 stop:348 length:231 start_codon:yes stop_codon:yes gene_type:complete